MIHRFMSTTNFILALSGFFEILKHTSLLTSKNALSLRRIMVNHSSFGEMIWKGNPVQDRNCARSCKSYKISQLSLPLSAWREGAAKRRVRRPAIIKSHIGSPGSDFLSDEQKCLHLSWLWRRCCPHRLLIRWMSPLYLPTYRQKPPRHLLFSVSPMRNWGALVPYT